MSKQVSRGRIILVAGMTTAGVLLAAVASASIPEPLAVGDSEWVNVPIADLDVSSPAGARQAIGRFRAAARRVCGPPPADSLSFGPLYAECMREIVNRAVIDLGSPTVEAMNDDQMR